MLEFLGPAHAPMPRPSLHSALGTALLLISPLAMALGFGPTRNHTTLVLTISDPATRNTLSTQVIAAGIEALGASEAKDEVRAVVLRGAGAHFCAGGNLQGLLERRAAGRAGPGGCRRRRNGRRRRATPPPGLRLWLRSRPAPRCRRR